MRIEKIDGSWRADRNVKLFIAHREAIALAAYPDGPYCSIGMGYNSPALREGDTITVKRAFELLDEAIKTREVQLSRLIKVPPTQEQFNALLSCLYQSGTRFIHDLIDMHNAKENPRVIGSAFSRPEHCTDSQGRFLEGLHNRRQLEGQLYSLGRYEDDLATVTLYLGNPKNHDTKRKSYTITLEDLPA